MSEPKLINPLDYETNPEALAELLGVDLVEAEQMIAIEKGDWGGDVMVADSEGRLTPHIHWRERQLA